MPPKFQLAMAGGTGWMLHYQGGRPLNMNVLSWHGARVS